MNNECMLWAEMKCNENGCEKKCEQTSHSSPILDMKMEDTHTQSEVRHDGNVQIWLGEAEEINTPTKWNV